MRLCGVVHRDWSRPRATFRRARAGAPGSSRRVASSTGRTTGPRRAPCRQDQAGPGVRRNSTVSAWSSRVCATATRVAAAERSPRHRSAAAPRGRQLRSTPATLRGRRHIGIADKRRNLETRRELSAEGGIGVCVGAADVVVEMREAADHQLTARRQLPQQEQHDPVRSAGHGCDHAQVPRPQRMRGGVTPDAINRCKLGHKMTTTVALLAHFAIAAASGQPAPALRIVVIEGEDAVNVIQQKTAVDRSSRSAIATTCPWPGRRSPLRSAATPRRLPAGCRPYRGHQRCGQAAAVAINPIASGAVQIQVAAAFQGQAAAATIAQTNVSPPRKPRPRPAPRVPVRRVGPRRVHYRRRRRRRWRRRLGHHIGIVGAAVAGGALAATKPGGEDSTPRDNEYRSAHLPRRCSRRLVAPAFSLLRAAGAVELDARISRSPALDPPAGNATITGATGRERGGGDLQGRAAGRKHTNVRHAGFRLLSWDDGRTSVSHAE